MDLKPACTVVAALASSLSSFTLFLACFALNELWTFVAAALSSCISLTWFLAFFALKDAWIFVAASVTSCVSSSSPTLWFWITIGCLDSFFSSTVFLATKAL